MTRDTDLQARARDMRRNPTEPEKRLWRSLSGSQTANAKFRRQHVVDPYIVDFFCPAKALVVEVDGDTHDATYDARRDRYLVAKGLRVLRFTNHDVMTNAVGVLEVISATIASAPDRWPCPETSEGAVTALAFGGGAS